MRQSPESSASLGPGRVESWRSPSASLFFLLSGNLKTGREVISSLSRLKPSTNGRGQQQPALTIVKVLC